MVRPEIDDGGAPGHRTRDPNAMHLVEGTLWFAEILEGRSTQ
jgi:hypothetical protein